MEQMLERTIELLKRGESPCMVTVVASSVLPLGARMLVQGDGAVVGAMGSTEFRRRVQQLVSRVRRAGCSSTARLPDDTLLFIDLLSAENRALICGAGHIALSLALYLRELRFGVTVLDDRPEFANQERFPGCDVVVQPFVTALRSMYIGPDTYAVVITRGHEHDVDCLSEILTRPTAYVGLIGSRRRVRVVKGNLLKAGLPVARVDELFTPVGLPLGSDSPEEIAMSIASEILCVRSRGAAHARLLREIGGVR